MAHQDSQLPPTQPPAPNDDPRRESLHRRDFLTYTSVGLLAPWLGPLAAGAADAAATALDAAVVPTQPLSVGHIEGSEDLRNLRRLHAAIRRPGRIEEGSETDETFRVVPAHRLGLGDTNLIGHPLRIRLHGLYPPAVALRKHWRELPRRFELDVLFPSPNPETQPPRRFLAWTFERMSYAWCNSQTLAFNFPLDWQALPAFELRTLGADRTKRSFATRFTFDTEEGLPRLRRGLYLLGLQPEAWESAVALSELGKVLPPERHSFLIAVESAGRGAS